MANKTHRVYYNSDGRPTFFEKRGDVYWCTHGDWEAKPTGNTLQFSDGEKLPFVRYEDLTLEEHDEARYVK